MEDLVSVEGKPNNPLYYLHDALGSVTSITNMNAGIIDSNRFAPYGEPLDPVAKNARLTNSPFGYTGEMHDIEGGLVYLRARYYEPGTMRFLQQDTELGDTQEPLSRNLYAYAGDNPVKYVDPTGHAYFTYSGNGYTWHPDTVFRLASRSGFSMFAPFGTAVQFIYDELRYGTSSSESDLEGILGSTLIDAASEIVKYKEIKGGVKIITQIGTWASRGKTALDAWKIVAQSDQTTNKVIEKSGLAGYLTNYDKEVVIKRVAFIQKYILNHKSNINYTNVRKSFEGYYDKNGNFIRGYLQNSENKSDPTYEFKFYNSDKYGTYFYRNVKLGTGYYSECWYDEVLYECYIKSDSSGWYQQTYWKNGKIKKEVKANF